MVRGGVVKAALGAALGVTARPGRRVDGEDQRPIAWTVGDEEAAQPILVDPSGGERLVEAPVTAGEHRLEAESGHRADRSRRADNRVAELEERIAPADERAAQLGAEPNEG